MYKLGFIAVGFIMVLGVNKNLYAQSFKYYKYGNVQWMCHARDSRREMVSSVGGRRDKSRRGQTTDYLWYNDRRGNRYTWKEITFKRYKLESIFSTKTNKYIKIKRDAYLKKEGTGNRCLINEELVKGTRYTYSSAINPPDNRNKMCEFELTVCRFR